MSIPNATRKWTCDRCGMSTARIDGEATPLPSTWASSAEGRFCLMCRRDRAASAAVASAPSDSPLAVRAGLGRAALIEFEVSRTPDHTDGVIAKACRTSVSAVAKARSRLRLPDPPSQPASMSRRVPSRRLPNTSTALPTSSPRSSALTPDAPDEREQP